MTNNSDIMSEAMRQIEDYASRLSASLEDAPIKVILERISAVEEYIQDTEREIGETEDFEEKVLMAVNGLGCICATTLSIMKSLAATLCVAMHQEEEKSAPPKKVDITGEVLGGL